MGVARTACGQTGSLPIQFSKKKKKTHSHTQIPRPFKTRKVNKQSNLNRKNHICTHIFLHISSIDLQHTVYFTSAFINVSFLYVRLPFPMNNLFISEGNASPFRRNPNEATRLSDRSIHIVVFVVVLVVFVVVDGTGADLFVETTAPALFSTRYTNLGLSLVFCRRRITVSKGVLFAVSIRHYWILIGRKSVCVIFFANVWAAKGCTNFPTHSQYQ